MKDSNKTKKQLIDELAELRQRITELETQQVAPGGSEEKLSHSQDEVAHNQRLLLALSQAAQAVQQARIPEEVYQAVAREVAGLGYHAFIFTLSDDQSYLVLSYTSVEPGLLQAAEKLAGTTAQGYRREIIPGDIYDQVLGENQALFIENMTDRLTDALPRLAHPLARRIVGMLGFERGIYAPLITGGQAYGLLVVAGSDLTKTDLPLVTAFANQAAIALENAQLCQTLRESEQMYRLLLETSPDAITTTDLEGHITYVSPRTLDLHGFEREEALLGKSAFEFIAPEDREKAAINLQKTLTEGSVGPVEYALLRGDGTRFAGELSATLIKDTHGDPKTFMSIVRDITERKQAEEALERRVAELSAFNAVATIVSQSLDVEQILNQTIDKMFRLVGIKAAGFHLLDETAGELKLTIHRGVSEEFAHTFSSLKLGEGVIGKVAQTGKPVVLDNLEDYLGVKKIYIGNGRLQSVAVVPLIGPNGLIGVMNLATTSPKYFDAVGLELLSGLGQQIAIGIEKARLYAETCTWAAELERRVEERTAELAASEACYHTLFDSTLDALTVIDMQGHYLDVNPAACQLLGYSREELLAMDVSQVGVRGRDASLEEQDQLLKQRQALWRQGASEYKTQLITKTGAVLDVEMTITPLIYDRQEAVLGLLRDISRRAQAEREIRQRTEDLALINALNEASNRGDSLQEIIGLLAQEVKKIFSGNGATVSLLSEDKKHLVMQNFTLSPAMVKRIEKLIGLNIPSLKIPLETSRLYKELLHTGQPLLSNDPETIQQLMVEFIESVHPTKRLRQRLQRFIPQIHKILAIQSVINVPLVSESETIGLLDISRAEPFAEADMQRLVTIASQLTALIRRKRAEEALQESEEKYRQLFEAESDAIFLIDNETGRILEVNAAGVTLYGYSRKELFQKKNTDLSAEPDETRKAMVERWPQVPVRFHRKKDGAVFPVEITGCHFSWRGREVHIAAIRDITERKQAEEKLKEYSERLEEMVEERTQELRETQEQLVRREKLAVLGQLAGSVAHELRNPLGVIKNAAYFLNMALDNPEPEVKQGLQILNREVGISDRIIKSLLDFARSKPPYRQAMNVNDAVRETLSRIDIPKGIKVVSRLDETLPVVLADPTQLKQVFDNLIRNAIQAMPEDGCLTIKSEMSDRDKLGNCSDWITVSINDTGIGISPKNLEKLFEPLFTTKAKGIGLGLALAKNLVEANEGVVEVQSKVGEGSTFMVRLPLEGCQEKRGQE
jgi:PAS domain S-box-containing protein